MKIYRKDNVWQAAIDRIAYLFDEFPNVVCGVSGGKDSTIVFNLCLMVARDKGRLPLRVLFLDQEAEWQATIDQIRLIMKHPDVKPMWMQVPIRLFNATSTVEHWLKCWDPEEEHRWMRPREKESYHENRYGTDRFAEMFGAIFKHEFPDTKSCYISGVRTEESPTRFMALTDMKTYQWITWGKVLDKRRRHFTFYPIYDWSYTDVWKAINDNGWPCVVLDIDEKKAKEYRIADNKTSELSTWDYENLMPELRELDLDVMQPFFADLDLSNMLNPTPMEYTPITDEEINDRQAESDNRFNEASSSNLNAMVEVVCPDCGHEFYVDRREINRIKVD